MHGFGVHTSMWTMNWDQAGAEKAIAASVGYGMDFIEIALLNAPAVDAEHSRRTAREEQSARCLLTRPARDTPGPPFARTRPSIISKSPSTRLPTWVP